MKCEEKSTTMHPMVGGKLSKKEESYHNACEMRAQESAQYEEKCGKFLKSKEKLGK